MKQTKTSRQSAFTLVEIMIVVAIIGLLAAIAIPNFVKARSTAQANVCINNLRQIDGAIQQWALESNKTTLDPVTLPNLDAYVGRGGGMETNCFCPLDATKRASASYTVTTVGAKPGCVPGATLGHVLP